MSMINVGGNPPLVDKAHVGAADGTNNPTHR